jgi:hypothetical protein
MKHQFSLTIASPCSEKWTEMLPSAEGKFCLHCQKNVTDFREMSDNEVAAFLYAHKGQKICGRISHKQKDRKYEFIQPERIESPVKRYVMAALAGLLTTFPTQVKAINHFVATQMEQMQNPPQDTVNAKHLSGRLLNQENGQPIAYVYVFLDLEMAVKNYLLTEKANQMNNGTQNAAYQQIHEKANWLLEEAKKWDFSQYQAKTDQNGYFYLVLPDNLPEMELYLKFSFVDATVKDATGKIVEGEQNSISVHGFYYKGGSEVLDVKAFVNKQLITREIETEWLGEMIYEE